MPGEIQKEIFNGYLKCRKDCQFKMEANHQIRLVLQNLLTQSLQEIRTSLISNIEKFKRKFEQFKV